MAYKHYLQRSERGKKEYLYRENSVQPATREETNFFPNILVIRSQSGVTSLRDKPAAES